MNKSNIKKQILFFFLLIAFFYKELLLAQNTSQDQLTIQQIGPLFCFGQNILPKYTGVVRLIPFYYNNHKNSFSYVSLQGIYSPLKNFIVLLDLPLILKNHGFGHRKGLADVRLQGEYAYYRTIDEHKGIECTIVGNVIVPTPPSTNSTPVTAGAVSTFWGTTASYLSQWYFYGSFGVTINTKYKNTQFGNQFLYQWIIGHQLPTIRDIISHLLIEFSGNYSQKNKVFNRKDENSGGNYIYAGPVLSLVSTKCALLSGIQGVFGKKLFGHQRPPNYRAAIMFVYKF